MLFLIFSNHHLFGLGFKTSSQCVFLLKDMIVDYVFFFEWPVFTKGFFSKLSHENSSVWTTTHSRHSHYLYGWSTPFRKSGFHFRPYQGKPMIHISPDHNAGYSWGGGGILGAIWTGRPRQNWPQLKWVPWRCQRFWARRDDHDYPSLGAGAWWHNFSNSCVLLAGGRWLKLWVFPKTLKKHMVFMISILGGHSRQHPGGGKPITEFWCLTFAACETRQNCFVTKKPVRCVFFVFQVEHFCFPHSRGFGLSEESSDLFEQSRASVVSSGTLSKCVKLRCIEKLLNYGWPTPRFTVGRFFTSFWWRGILLY